MAWLGKGFTGGLTGGGNADPLVGFSFIEVELEWKPSDPEKDPLIVPEPVDEAEGLRVLMLFLGTVRTP